MSDPTVLLIDDDQILLELLADHLENAGFQALRADAGVKGLALARDKQPQLVILDVMMPGMDGWTVCQQLRTESNVPIIMLTAKGQEVDKLRGFRLGVDDYVTKPFSFAELTARAKAVLARFQSAGPTAHIISSGDLTIDLSLRVVTVAGESVDLTPTEYRLLESLVRNANRTISTEHILSLVWGPEYTGEIKHVKHYIWSLRRKIEADPGNPQHIFTERGFGYRFA